MKSDLALKLKGMNDARYFLWLAAAGLKMAGSSLFSATAYELLAEVDKELDSLEEEARKIKP